MTLIPCPGRRQCKAWFLIVLVLSLDVHAARMKLPSSSAGPVSLQGDGSTELKQEDADREEVQALAEGLSRMSEGEARAILNDMADSESELSRPFMVDVDPGSLSSRATSQHFHYKAYRYSVTLSSKVLLNLYSEKKMGVEDQPYRSMEILPDSEISMRHGKHGPSVLVTGVETQATYKRSTWKFRFRGENAEEIAKTVEYLEQLLKDLQSATFFAMPSSTGPQLATCKLLRDEGTCFPRHTCIHVVPGKSEPKGQECFPKTEDAAMATAWTNLLHDLKVTSEKVLAKNCLRDCDKEWYFLTSHAQVARTVLDGVEVFDDTTYSTLAGVLKTTEGELSAIETDMAKAVDKLPNEALSSKTCKLPRTLEQLTLLDGADEETIEKATQDYVKDCPELMTQVDTTMKQIEEVAIDHGMSSESALIALRQRVDSNSTLAMAFPGYSLMQSTGESAFIELGVGMVLGCLYLVLAAFITGMIVYVVVYLILKLITIMVCSLLSRLKSKETRGDFQKKCVAGGSKFAGWVAAFIGLGVGIFFGGPIAYTALAGGGAAGVAAILAPLGTLTTAPGAAFASMVAPVTQTWFVSFGTVGAAHNFGLALSYGLSIYTVGKMNSLLWRWEYRRRDARTWAKKKKIEDKRKVLWKTEYGVDYPWKKTDWGSYENVETEEESDEMPIFELLPPLPKPWKEVWKPNDKVDEDNPTSISGHYFFWHPELKIGAPPKRRAKVMSGEEEAEERARRKDKKKNQKNNDEAERKQRLAELKEKKKKKNNNAPEGNEDS